MPYIFSAGIPILPLGTISYENYLLALCHLKWNPLIVTDDTGPDRRIEMETNGQAIVTQIRMNGSAW